MPEFHKLSREEVEQVVTKKKPSERALIREQYNRFLADIEEGEGGELLLVEGDNRTTVRNRIKSAAETLGKNITFLRTRDNALRFRVLGPRPQGNQASGAGEETPANGATTGVQDSPQAADAAPKRGRRRRTTAEEPVAIG